MKRASSIALASASLEKLPDQVTKLELACAPEVTGETVILEREEVYESEWDEPIMLKVIEWSSEECSSCLMVRVVPSLNFQS